MIGVVKLAIDFGKTKAMLFTSHKLGKFPVTKNHNITIDYVTSFKYLGLIIDSGLSHLKNMPC